MSHTLSRRSMLSGSAMTLAAVTLLAGCKTISADGTTHGVSVNVSKIKAYAVAGLNAAATISTLLSVIPAYAPYGLVIAGATSLLKADLESFTQAAGNMSTLTVDTSSTGSLVHSLVNDLDQVLSAIGALTRSDTVSSLGLSPALHNTVATITTALTTIVSIFQVLLGTMVTTGAGGQTMSEEEALRTLNVT